MIKSMTGYGKNEFSDENINFDLEIKSVNSRYLDLNIRMPYQLNQFEDKITKLIKNKINRGRVDLFIRSKSKSFGKIKIEVNEELAIEMADKLNMISKITKFDKFSPSEILKNEDVLIFKTNDLDEEYIYSTLSNSINTALEKLLEMRIEEGKNLKSDLLKNISKLIDYKDKIKEHIKDIKLEIVEKLKNSLSQFIDESSINKDRLANEVVLYADKSDINEELVRLESHFEQFKNTLELDVPVGKKLDFITQEMLRETNTIGSKTSKIEVINLVIEMKTIIEKIKEQVQNIE